MPDLIWTTILNPKDVPTTAGVYQYVQGKEIIYIGKAVNLRARLNTHAQAARHDEHERLITNADTIRYTETDTEFKALLLEASLIQKYLPRYNRALRDDKSYLYIFIDTGEDYPKPKLFRSRDLDSRRLSKKTRIFGPFPSTKVAEEVLKVIRRLIPFCQQASVGKRACFYSHLGLCNPCPSTIQQFSFRECKLLTRKYRQQIFQIIRILEGKIDPVIKDLQKELEKASASLDFEKSIELRDKIFNFQSYIQNHSFSDRRVLEYSNSDKDLAELEKLLRLYFPLLVSLKRIECYDASTFALSHSVVSMVVATEGSLDKGQYRRFRVKNVRAVSDFDMLEEALVRRLKNPRWGIPNLILIDGGRPQLRRLQPLLDKQEEPPLMVGIAKHPDKLVFLLDKEYLTVDLPRDSGATHLLERLRDEAHRFGNSYRKILEQKQKKF